MNLYWSVYRNLEKELLILSNQIHLDDKQLSVYSVKISELLIRCSVEIESITKDLFLENGGTLPTGRDLYFDTDCLEHLEGLWRLSKKQALVVAQNFYFTDAVNQVLTPLNRANKRGTSGSDWKKAYQAVKHDRTYSLAKGNLFHLIRALAALYLLNIYNRNENYDLDKDSAGSSFDERLGSEIFSVKLHVSVSIDIDGLYKKNEDYEECVYILKATDETAQAVRNSLQTIQDKQKKLATEHLLKKILEKVKKGTKITAENIQSQIESIAISENEKMGSEFLMKAARTESSSFRNLKYEAMINRNQY